MGKKKRTSRRKRRPKPSAPVSGQRRKAKPTAKEIRAVKRATEAMQLHFQYQNEMVSDGCGFRSSQLRDDAHKLSATGRQVEAHALFEQAASLFKMDDVGAAAASCWYDLAESFKKLEDLRARENLQEAEQLLERCLASPVRQRDTLRMAMTHDCLGQVYRRLATLANNERKKHKLEDRSILAHEKACALVAPLPFLGDIYGHRYLGNLGNALGRRGHTRRAIESYEQALADLGRAQSEYPELLEAIPSDKPPGPSLRMNFAELLARLDKGGEHGGRILQLVDRVASEGDGQLCARGHYLALVTLQKQGSSDHACLDGHITALETRFLPPELIPDYVELLVAIGRHELALRITHDGQQKALLSRQQTLADHSADAVAEYAQRFGLLEAQIHVAAGRPIDAFLAIENVSALRYFDNVKVWGWSHRDPVARALTKRAQTLSSPAIQLDELSAHLAQVPREVQVSNLTETIAGLGATRDEANSDEHTLVAFDWFLAQLRLALGNGSPVAFLRQRAKGMLKEVERLNTAASLREPQFARENQCCHAPATPDELAELLREHPGSLMLRLHWSSDLLATAAWLEDDQLVGKAARLPLRVDSLSPSLYLASFDDGSEKAPYQGPAMAEILAELDLSPVLPPCPSSPRGHLFLLPSGYASIIPWAAAGPLGSTLLDRFESISWLPNLTPLRMRQVQWRERSGAVIVCPGGSQSQPTPSYLRAFAGTLPGETRIFEREATIANARSAAARSDVVAFYAHGAFRLGDSGYLCLVDGKFDVGTLGRDFVGCERVELWACRSGVNRSTNPLTPFFVDEAFGMDTAFHHAGVRSTIGTLWSVLQLVTTKLVSRYRAGLKAGYLAPKALAHAQRWWRDQLLQIRRWLDERPLNDAWRAITNLLDANESDPVHEILATLNRSSKHTSESIWAIFSPPETWAGFRFMGVCERRPRGDQIPEKVVLDVEQRTQFLAILAQEDVAPLDPDEQLHARRFALYEGLYGRVSPTLDEAIAAARTYDDIRQGRENHRLLRGLAWLYEALACEPSLADRAQLEREAAWLWLGLARGGLPDERLRFMYRADPVYVARLDGLAARRTHPDANVLLAWAWLLQHPSEAAMDDESIVAGLLERWETAWASALQLPALDYEGLRTRIAAAALLLALSKPPEAAVARVHAEVDQLGVMPADLHRSASSLLAVATELAARLDNYTYPEPHFAFLKHADVVLMVQRAHLRTTDEPTPNHQRHLRKLEDDALGKLEMDFWGCPSDGLNFWRTSGAPGLPWYWAISAFTHTRLARRYDSAIVPHVLASLQLGCDLRLGPLAAFARLLGTSRILSAQKRALACWPWNLLWQREHLLNALEDTSRLQVPFSAGVQPNRHDPFRTGKSDLLKIDGEDPTAFPAWELADVTRRWSRDAPASKTAAFDAERHLCRLDHQAEQQIPDLLEEFRSRGLASPTERFDDPDPQRAFMQAQAPMVRIQAAERTVREQAVGTGILGVSSGSRGELCFALVWREARGLKTQRLVLEQVGGRVRDLLHQLCGIELTDAEPLVGVKTARTKAWTALCQLLDSPLAELLADVPRQTVISVLSPGFLRPLPWAGLTRGGRPLREDFVVAHLPHLGFGQSSRPMQKPVAHPSTVCVLGQEREDGETCFGEASIATLRACFPVRATAEPRDSISEPTIREVDVILPLAPEIELLRFYGSASPIDYGQGSSSIRLRGRRTFRAFNLSGTLLPRCELVEVWAATGRGSQARMIHDADHDRIPGLAWAALASGAAAVLDLAWPIHDLVKALVCERFGLLRRLEPQPGSIVLALAVREIDDLLRRWEAHSTARGSVGEALDWLDRERGRFLADRGLDHRLAVPYTQHLSAPSVDFPSALALVLCCRRPEQLAPFRWWGSPRPGML